MEQDQYEEDVKVVILPDRLEVTQEDLATMPDVVRERVRHESHLLEVHILSGLSKFICLPSDVRSPEGIPVNRGYLGC